MDYTQLDCMILFRSCIINLTLPSCRDILMEYSKHVMELGYELLELLSEALGLKPSHLKDMNCAEGLLLLCHYYPPCPQPELAIGTSRHSDNDFLTVLLQDHVGGLQVLHQNQWVDVPPTPGALVVNIGDLMQACYVNFHHQSYVNLHRYGRICSLSIYLSDFCS